VNSSNGSSGWGTALLRSKVRKEFPTVRLGVLVRGWSLTGGSMPRLAWVSFSYSRTNREILRHAYIPPCRRRNTQYCRICWAGYRRWLDLRKTFRRRIYYGWWYQWHSGDLYWDRVVRLVGDRGGATDTSLMGCTLGRATPCFTLRAALLVFFWSFVLLFFWSFVLLLLLFWSR